MPRDGSGNYTLPAGNPVVDGTTIETTWANPTMSDIALQLNNVLTRDGLLGPITQFKLVDGLVTAPGLGFASELGTGLFRASGSFAGWTYQGAQHWLSSPGKMIHYVPTTMFPVAGDPTALILQALASDATHVYQSFRNGSGTEVAWFEAGSASFIYHVGVSGGYSFYVGGVAPLTISSQQVAGNVPALFKALSGTYTAMSLWAGSSLGVGNLNMMDSGGSAVLAQIAWDNNTNGLMEFRVPANSHGFGIAIGSGGSVRLRMSPLGYAGFHSNTGGANGDPTYPFQIRSATNTCLALLNTATGALQTSIQHSGSTDSILECHTGGLNLKALNGVFLSASTGIQLAFTSTKVVTFEYSGITPRMMWSGTSVSDNLYFSNNNGAHSFQVGVGTDYMLRVLSTTVEIANTLNVITGSNSVGTINAVNINASQRVTGSGTTRKFVSAEQTCPSASAGIVVAHGLGAEPTWFEARFRCKVAQYGYAIGDEIKIVNDLYDGSQQMAISANGTDVSWNYGVSLAQPPTIWAPGFGLQTLTPANWRVVFYATLTT